MPPLLAQRLKIVRLIAFSFEVSVIIMIVLGFFVAAQVGVRPELDARTESIVRWTVYGVAVTMQLLSTMVVTALNRPVSTLEQLALQLQTRTVVGLAFAETAAALGFCLTLLRRDPTDVALLGALAFILVLGRWPREFDWERAVQEARWSAGSSDSGARGDLGR